MPLRREARFLRDRARRLHEIAGVYQTALSQQLRAMAEELEARADELERAEPPSRCRLAKRRRGFSLRYQIPVL